MSYDGSIQEELAGYFEEKEPGRRERADAWAMAIGLQKVDGLTPSRHLVSLAKKHIEGRISQKDVYRLLQEYYETKDERREINPEEEEPDKVAERISAIVNETGFAFSPEYLKSIHRKLFCNLLLGEDNELMSRYLLIGIDHPPRRSRQGRALGSLFVRGLTQVFTD